MKKFNIELTVGLFLLAGFFCFAYLSVNLGGIELFGSHSYRVVARFDSVAGLKKGASVEISGVKIGKVNNIGLEDEQALVEIFIDIGVELQEDVIASIKTQGVIGDKYIRILPGGSEDLIADGGEIFETESAIDIEELISKYVFGKV